MPANTKVNLNITERSLIDTLAAGRAEQLNKNNK